MTTLHEYLSRRLQSAYRRLEQSLDGLEDADLERGAQSDWRRYRFGTGLDGSIGGMLRHVGVWKHVFAIGLETGCFPEAESLLPPDLHGAGLRDWLAEGQQRLTVVLAKLTEADLVREVVVGEQRMSLPECFAHMIEHDQYHAGQVNLLRQQWGHDLS